MSCAEFEDARLLSACGEPAGEDFEAHQAACAECREEVERLRAAREAYRKTQDEAMPAPLRARLARPRRAPWALAAAGLAAIALWLVLRTTTTTPPIEAPAQWERLERGISQELSRIDQELGWHELVLKEKP